MMKNKQNVYFSDYYKYNTRAQTNKMVCIT